MIVIDKELLAQFRAKTVCEFCGQRVPTGLSPHHIFAKGMGGGGRLDVDENLIALCPPITGNNCHDKFHTGKIPRALLLEIVAKREGTTVAKITAFIHELRRRDKTCLLDVARLRRAYRNGERR